MNAYTEEKEEVEEGVVWRNREGGRNMRQGRADPVRSAASPLDLQSRDKEEAIQLSDLKQRSILRASIPWIHT